MLAGESYAGDHGATTLSLHVFGHQTVTRAMYESLRCQTTNINMAKSLLPAGG
jgi:hypothetical protein